MNYHNDDERKGFSTFDLLLELGTMARRKASARPSFLSAAVVPIAEDMSVAVAAESTDQCDTSRARAPA